MNRGLSRFLWVVLIVGCVSGVAGSPRAERARALRELRSDLDLAAQAVREGRLDRAVSVYRDAVERSERLGRPNLALARALDGLADACRLKGSLAEAERSYLRAAKMWPELLGERQPRLAVTLHNLGLVYLAEGRRAEARSRFRRALSIWEATLGADSAEAENTRRAYRRAAPDSEEATGSR